MYCYFQETKLVEVDGLVPTIIARICPSSFGWLASYLGDCFVNTICFAHKCGQWLHEQYSYPAQIKRVTASYETLRQVATIEALYMPPPLSTLVNSSLTCLLSTTNSHFKLLSESLSEYKECRWGLTKQEDCRGGILAPQPACHYIHVKSKVIFMLFFIVVLIIHSWSLKLNSKFPYLKVGGTAAGATLRPLTLYLCPAWHSCSKARIKFIPCFDSN